MMAGKGRLIQFRCLVLQASDMTILFEHVWPSLSNLWELPELRKNHPVSRSKDTTCFWKPGRMASDFPGHFCHCLGFKMMQIHGA